MTVLNGRPEIILTRRTLENHLQFTFQNYSEKCVNNRRLFGLLILLVLIPAKLSLAFEIGIPQPELENAGRSTIPDKKLGLEEMREWLNQRNQDRKIHGTSQPENFNSIKQYTASIKPRLKRGRKNSKADMMVEGGPAQSRQNFAAQMAERGPDGRIRHRLQINENGPDQLQIYTRSGFSKPIEPDEEALKMERLTARGKQAWMAGSYLRLPASYHVLKPKGWNHPKYGNR